VLKKELEQGDLSDKRSVEEDTVIKELYVPVIDGFLLMLTQDLN
jgi:hypothetical protein